ncbi:uncharacterized protein FMAN_09776 [Fusarium mangiferae]|uniref:Uncharacterized protein n=1 Tax=Fusarium mangiferae TaxID=192010 RepID=A0A1L7TQS3_FUSMA|nr:uncharacterized protein FMAN_09776 [Fusarium mangiferae]CVL00269.1 uncharacterized protein FMAN_09776 [Fusarium mangiferae]
MTTARRSAATRDLHQGNVAFLESFAAKEAQRRAAKQKPTLTIEEHAAHRAQLADVLFIKPKYADETEINVTGIFRKWVRGRLESDDSKPQTRDDAGLRSLYVRTLQHQIMGQHP